MGRIWIIRDTHFNHKSIIDKFEFRNKIVYIGAYIETSLGRFRHGKGKITYQNGNYYDGVWHAGEKHGWGIVKTEDKIEVRRRIKQLIVAGRKVISD